MAFRNNDAVGYFGGMKDCAAAGNSSDNINFFFTAGLQIDFFMDALEIADGNCVRLPAIEPEGWRDPFFSDRLKDCLILAHIEKRIVKARFQQSDFICHERHSSKFPSRICR